MQKGFTIIEVLIVLAILTVLIAIAIPELHKARIRSQTGAVVADARTLYTAIKQYQIDESSYYDDLELSTFEPLASDWKFRSNVTRLLRDGRADAYDSPDDEGANQEFWLEFTLAQDHSVRIVVADSDNAPLGGGQRLDGVYRFKDGVLDPL